MINPFYYDIINIINIKTIYKPVSTTVKQEQN